MSPSSTAHGGQYGTKHVTFEQLSHVAFMVDKIWGDKLEPQLVDRSVLNASTARYCNQRHHQQQCADADHADGLH